MPSTTSSSPPKYYSTDNISDNTQNTIYQGEHRSRCSNYLVPATIPTLTLQVDKISSSLNPTISTQFNPSFPTSDFPLQENSTTSNGLTSFSPSTATIPQQEFYSFTTDSQSSWLPTSNSTSLPAQSPHQSSPYLNSLDTAQQVPNQDFVLFESRTPNVRRTPSLSNSTAFIGQNRRHSSHLASASPSLQNQRVAAIIQATGHSTTTSAFTNRFNPSAHSAQLQQHQQQQFHASAPASPATLHQQQRPRPQVPLFSQSTGSIPRTPNMTFQDMDLFDEFTAFEGGASTTNAYSSAYSSPAVTTMYDPSTILSTSNSSTTNMSTVSPQDLLVSDTFVSAPNSTSFTNLTSPSTYNESPEFNDYELSPFVNGSHDGLNVHGDPWFPLFPTENQADEQQKDEPELEHSPLIVEEEVEIADELNEREKKTRGRSGSAASPSASHSSKSGIRKREKVLPPIVVEDPSDTQAMKRARNTLAARKSRQRKMQRFEELEEQIAKLSAERDHWKSIALRRSGGQ